jgi:hypothetical protein
MIVDTCFCVYVLAQKLLIGYFGRIIGNLHRNIRRYTTVQCHESGSKCGRRRERQIGWNRWARTELMLNELVKDGIVKWCPVSAWRRYIALGAIQFRNMYVYIEHAPAQLEHYLQQHLFDQLIG